MEMEKYTERSKGFIQSAQNLALRSGHQRLLPEHLLKVLLEVDKEAESQTQEHTLRGVRKAQAKLASFYLVAGETGVKFARQIFDDMKDERPERLRSICDELLRIESKDFWEVIDRGTNFDYVDATRKAQLKVFFSWFPSLSKEAAHA